jgi:hypothetical protein
MLNDEICNGEALAIYLDHPDKPGDDSLRRVMTLCAG